MVWREDVKIHKELSLRVWEKDNGKWNDESHGNKILIKIIVTRNCSEVDRKHERSDGGESQFVTSDLIKGKIG